MKRHAASIPRGRTLSWRPLVLAAMVLATARPVSGEERRLIFDPESTEIRFSLGATLHTVEGSARLARGEIVLDLEDQTASGEVVVDAKSAATGNAKRDRKMHRNVLRSEEFPEIVLAPVSWEGELDLGGTSKLTVHGRFELLGTAHDVVVPVNVRPADGGVVLDFELEVPYVEWGLDDPSSFVLRVAKSVTVEVHATAQLPSASPAPSSSAD